MIKAGIKMLKSKLHKILLEYKRNRDKTSSLISGHMSDNGLDSFVYDYFIKHMKKDVYYGHIDESMNKKYAKKVNKLLSRINNPAMEKTVLQEYIHSHSSQSKTDKKSIESMVLRLMTYKAALFMDLYMDYSGKSRCSGPFYEENKALNKLVHEFMGISGFNPDNPGKWLHCPKTEYSRKRTASQWDIADSMAYRIYSMMMLSPKSITMLFESAFKKPYSVRAMKSANALDCMYFMLEKEDREQLVRGIQHSIAT